MLNHLGARNCFWKCARSLVVLLPMSGLTAGCATTQTSSQIDRLEVVEEDPRILLMPPDIRYYLLTAGGVPEPNAEWTQAAQENFTAALEEYSRSRGIELVIMGDEASLSIEEDRYRKLHSAVGMTLQTNHFGGFPLPSKRLPDGERVFDWSLGSGVSEIGERYDADYLLFTYYRDYQASGGRVAFAILAGLAGVGVATGYEGGFASLVDLRSGDVVWFRNVAIGGSGEMRDPDGATIAVANLFSDLPTPEN